MPPRDNVFQCPACGLPMTLAQREEAMLEIHAPCPACAADIVVSSGEDGAPRARIFDPDTAEKPTAGGTRTSVGGLVKTAAALLAGAAVVMGWSYLRPAPPSATAPRISGAAPASDTIEAPIAKSTSPSEVEAVPAPSEAQTDVDTPPVTAPDNIPLPPADASPPPLVDPVSPEPVPAPPVEESSPSPSPVPVHKDYKSSPLAGPPRDALERFLTAVDWRERLKYSQNPSTTGPLMEAYYRDHKDGPVRASHLTLVESDTVAETGQKLHLFLVGIDSLSLDLPVSVEETTDGFRVDWQTFIEGYDGRLDAFCSTYRASPGDFRVSLRRTHYFGEPAAWQKDAVCFSIDGPAPREQFQVWVPAKSALIQGKLKQGDRLGWDVISHPVARLQWRREKDGVEWRELVDLPADSWRSAAPR